MRNTHFAVAMMLAVGILATLTTTAFALELPDAHVLSGEQYPVSAEGAISGTNVALVESELGEHFTASGVKVVGEFTELSPIGVGTLTYTGLLDPKTSSTCRTVGQPEGTAQILGEYHLVDISTAPLTVAALLTFKELVLECNSGKIKIKVRGPVLLKLEKITSGTDLVEFGVVAHCTGKGKQELKEYFNDEGNKEKAIMTANWGLGFEVSCKQFNQELVVRTSKMVDVLF